MWKGTAEILNASPTNINTKPKVNPYWFKSTARAIKLKFVDPEKPYIKEQPYNKRPEDKALNTKYFNPASEDFNSFLLNDANTYKASDCSSRPI